MVEAGRVTAIIDGDIGPLRNALNQAKSQAVTSVSGIESEMKSKLGAGLSGALSGGDYGKAGKQIGNSLISGITSSFGPLGDAAGEIATTLGPAGIVATAAIAGAVVIGSAAISAANEWEAGMSKISKTTGIEKGSTGFNELNDDLKDLYATMPTTVSEIQNVASSAGSLGIAKSEIAGFTQVALQMGSAFDIPAEQAAVSVGKIKSQLKSYSSEVKDASGAVNDSKFAQHFGSAVDFAGNELNATESEVLDFSTRTAGAFSNLGGNMYELAGWGGELASVFSSSELASGSFNAALNQLMGTTKGSENARAKAGELLGVTPEEFQALMTNDPTDTLLDIGKAMEGLSDTDRFQAAGILGGGYGDDFFQKMVGKTDEWRGKIEEVKQAGESGTSIGTSYGAGVDQALAQLQVLKNSVGAILTDIGGPIGSAMTPVISAIAGGLNKVRAIGENLWGPFTTAISPATTAVSLLFEGVSTLAGMQMDGLVAASEAINTGFKVGSAFVSAFGEELTKIVTESSTFQTISGYVDQVGTAFENLATGAGEVFDKIVSGLSDAIPTAVSGAASAVGSLFDQAGLGGVTDAFSGVSGFLGDVYDNAAEKLGWGVEKGTEEGMEKGSEAAKDGVADAVTDAVKTGVNDGFDSAKDALVKSGVSKELAGYMAAFGMSDSSALAAYNRQYSTVKDNVIDTNVALRGQDYIIRNIATSQGSYYKLLSSSGEVLGGTGLMTPGQLGSFNPVNWATSILPQQDQILDAYLNISKNIESELSSAGSDISEAYLSGMNFDQATLMDHLYNLQMLKFYDPDEAKAQGVDAATAYMESLISAVNEYDTAKANYLLAPNDAEAKAALEASAAKLQATADGLPISMKLTADDSDFIKVLTAYFKNNGNVDWNALGVSNPSRYLEYAKSQLSSEVSTYAEQGRTIPEGETLNLFTALQSWFHENYSSLDNVNRQSSALLDQAIAKGGTYWDALYAQMGLLSTEVGTAGTKAGEAIQTKSTAGAQKIFDSAAYFKLETNSAGQNIAVIGSAAKTDGIAGGAGMRAGGQDGGSAVLAGCQTGAAALVESAGSVRSIMNAAASTNTLKSIMSTASSSGVSSVYPIAATTKTTSLGFSSGSDLNNFGGVPKGWTTAVSEASEATKGAVAQTGNLTSGVTSLDGTSGSCTSSVSGLNSELSQFHVLAAATATTLATSSASLAASNNLLQYTAEGVSDSMYDCECAISDFAKAQESTAGLFYASYIGPTSGYSGVAGGGAATSSTYTLPAIFSSFANEGYVASPTLAVVGDRPGGEYVVGAARFENAVGKMGGGITVNYSPTINGSGLSASELADVLEKNNKALVAEITNAARGL